jgi:hypothetical protein
VLEEENDIEHGMSEGIQYVRPAVLRASWHRLKALDGCRSRACLDMAFASTFRGMLLRLSGCMERIREEQSWKEGGRCEDMVMG